MSKKYSLLPYDSMEVNGRTLYRIIALKRINPNVDAGDVGGYVEEYHNLSQSGTCWVYNDAMVYDKARVSGYARIENSAKVYGHARVRDHARVCNSAQVYDRARISGSAQVWMTGSVFGKARVSDYSEVYGDAQVAGNVRIRWHTDVYGHTHLSGNLRIGNRNRSMCITKSMSTVNKLGNFPRKPWFNIGELAAQTLRE